MNNGAFGENFPYSNFHDLNLDWIVKIAKDFLDQYTHIQDTIDQGLTDLQEKADTLEGLLQEWYDTHSEDIANQLEEALTDLATAMNNALQTFTVQANERAQQAIATIPSDYSAFYAEMHDQTLTWQRYLTASDNAVSLKMGVYGISSANNLHPSNLPSDYPTTGSGIIVALERAYSASASELYFCLRPNTNYFWIYTGNWYKVTTNDFLHSLLDPIISNVGSDKYAPEAPFTFNSTQFKFLDGDGVGTVGSDWTTWYVSDNIEINSNTMYMISASARFADHDLYQFLDASGNIVHRETIPSASAMTIENKLIMSPSNVKYIRIASIHGANSIKLSTVKEAYFNPLWRGKKWACIGDSITEPNNRSTKNYVDYVVEATDITAINLGRGGTGFKREYAGEGAYMDRLDEIPADTDVVTIMASGNDGIYSVGTPTDTGTDTLCGCINTTIQRLFTQMPMCNVGIITSIPWENGNPSDHTNWFSRYSEAIVEICKNWGIPCLDLFHCSNLRPWDATFRQYAYTRDDGNGVHPDENGHKLFAPRIGDFLESLLMP